MASRDTQFSRLRRGGSGRYNDYDDEGRGSSKYFWTEFESMFEKSDYSEEWLMGTHVEGVDPTLARLFTGGSINTFITGKERTLLDVGLYDGRLFAYIQSMRDRYNVHDWALSKFEDFEGNRGRVRELVVKKLGVQVWQRLQARAHDVWLNIDEKKKEHGAELADEQEQAQSVFAAETIKREAKEVTKIRKESDLIAGAIRSDFDSAFSLEEVRGQIEGDWLDDPVAAATSGFGFGEEVRRPSGIQLQVTVSLDMSNSMYYNGVHKIAAESFRDIYLALEAIKKEHPEDLHISAFTFANDGYEPKDRGRRAENLTAERKWVRNDADRWEMRTVINESNDHKLGAVEKFRDGAMTYHFSGEDTWMYPLFEEIEKWENEHSEAGAVRLDIIITDAVIEHPSDIRRSDVIQARRNGTLQTVMLNFLPEDEWVESDLPLNCVQYAATPDNISGLLRNLLTEFVSVYL